jgi:nucleoid DNA-binding protein
MTYSDLVKQLSDRTNLHTDVIRHVLIFLPEILQEMPLNDKVNTPLGVFHMHHRPEGSKHLPYGGRAPILEMGVIKLRPGPKMYRELTTVDQSRKKPTKVQK